MATSLQLTEGSTTVTDGLARGKFNQSVYFLSCRASKGRGYLWMQIKLGLGKRETIVQGIVGKCSSALLSILQALLVYFKEGKIMHSLLPLHGALLWAKAPVYNRKHT